ncbi:MAG: DUF5685 family protein [Oscillospiraceae bacterium]|nr:DUF5685 family protein [Oscillospiraceae bacterium]MDD4367478.1 DUF5685 family protein [Oscillospiraceae bacterium]
MYGNVRPLKEELKIREFNIYRGYYCGLCQAIRNHYGQLPRLSLSYDLTFMAIYLHALQPDPPDWAQVSCLIHPRQKRPAVQPDPALDYSAAVSVLLAEGKLQDNIQDGEKRVLNQGLKLIWQSAAARARRAYPLAWKLIRQHLSELNAAELQQNPASAGSIDPVLAGTVFNQADEAASGLTDSMTVSCRAFAGADPAATAFGNLLAELMLLGLQTAGVTGLTTGQQAAVRTGMTALGRWVYYADALADWQADQTAGRYNALLRAAVLPVTADAWAQSQANYPETAQLDLSQASAWMLYRVKADYLLFTQQADCAQALELLPYQRLQPLVGNILTQGLPAVARQIAAGRPLNKL